MPQYRGMLGQGSRSQWVGEQAEGGWDKSFPDGKQKRGIPFEMKIKKISNKKANVNMCIGMIYDFIDS